MHSLVARKDISGAWHNSQNARLRFSQIRALMQNPHHAIADIEGQGFIVRGLICADLEELLLPLALGKATIAMLVSQLSGAPITTCICCRTI